MFFSIDNKLVINMCNQPLQRQASAPLQEYSLCLRP
jgi:hypothetical protein